MGTGWSTHKSTESRVLILSTSEPNATYIWQFLLFKDRWQASVLGGHTPDIPNAGFGDWDLVPPLGWGWVVISVPQYPCVWPSELPAIRLLSFGIDLLLGFQGWWEVGGVVSMDGRGGVHPEGHREVSELCCFAHSKIKRYFLIFRCIYLLFSFSPVIYKHLPLEDLTSCLPYQFYELFIIFIFYFFMNSLYIECWLICYILHSLPFFLLHLFWT